jgi:hypothetical protein
MTHALWTPGCTAAPAGQWRSSNPAERSAQRTPSSAGRQEWAGVIDACSATMPGSAHVHGGTSSSVDGWYAAVAYCNMQHAATAQDAWKFRLQCCRVYELTLTRGQYFARDSRLSACNANGCTEHEQVPRGDWRVTYLMLSAASVGIHLVLQRLLLYTCTTSGEGACSGTSRQ